MNTANLNAAQYLTKRELFAAMAMQGLLAKYGDDTYTSEGIAMLAVNRADATLAQLERTREAKL